MIPFNDRPLRYFYTVAEEGNDTLGKGYFDLGKQLAGSLSDTPKTGHLRLQLGISSFIPKAIAHSVLNF